MFTSKTLSLLLAISTFTILSSGELVDVDESQTAQMVSNVSQNLVDITKQEVEVFLSQPNNETLSTLLNSLALPLGKVIQLVLGSGMNVSESANLVGLIVGDWLNATVEGNLTALNVSEVENEVVDSVEVTLNKNMG